MRRRFTSPEAACTTSTVSTLLATVCDSARIASDDARRVSAEPRGNTCSTRSKSSEINTQSPTATSAPMLRTRSLSVVESKMVLQPRSIRPTRPTRRVEISCEIFCEVANMCSFNRTFQPSATMPATPSILKSSCAGSVISLVTLAKLNPYCIWVYVDTLDKAVSNNVTMKSHV